jgi:hypothetical protein
MSLGSKMTSLQAYNMLIYRRALHPEFFGIEGRRRLVHGDFEFEAWIFRGGHALRMQHEGNCVCELVTDQLEHLPEEERIGEDVTFMTSIQTETLSDHLYVGTYRELLDHARAANSLLVQWDDEQGKGNLSMLDMQRFRDEVHMQGYHMRSDCGLVLRTQSMFQLAADPVAGV